MDNTGKIKQYLHKLQIQSLLEFDLGLIRDIKSLPKYPNKPPFNGSLKVRKYWKKVKFEDETVNFQPELIEQIKSLLDFLSIEFDWSDLLVAEYNSPKQQYAWNMMEYYLTLHSDLFEQIEEERNQLFSDLSVARRYL